MWKADKCRVRRVDLNICSTNFACAQSRLWRKLSLMIRSSSSDNKGNFYFFTINTTTKMMLLSYPECNICLWYALQTWLAGERRSVLTLSYCIRCTKQLTNYRSLDCLWLVSLSTLSLTHPLTCPKSYRWDAARDAIPWSSSMFMTTIAEIDVKPYS